MCNPARVVAERCGFFAVASGARLGLELARLASRERRARGKARERCRFGGLRAELPRRSA